MRLTIKLKLILAFAAVIVLSGSWRWWASAASAALDGTLQQLVRGPAQRLETDPVDVQRRLLQDRAEKNLLLADTAQDNARYEGEEQVAMQQVQQHRAAYLALATPTGREKMGLFDRAYQQLVVVQERVRELDSQGHAADARNTSWLQGRPLIQEAMKHLEELVRLNRELVAAAQVEAAEQYVTARFWLVSVVMATLLVAVGMATWISLSIGRGLANARELANAVAQGDLARNVAVRGNDEIRISSRR
ncbi:MAG: hypothetical protein WDN25_13005 [Acetobacteraceae bacterium]